MDACSVCQRPDRADVDAALSRGDAVNRTADRFGISRTTLKRHAKHRGAKPGDEAPAPAPVTAEPPPSPSSAEAPPAPPSPALTLETASPPPELPPAAPEVPPPADPSLVDYVAELAAAPPPAPIGRVGKGRVCACCSSPHRAEIDRRLIAGQSAHAIEAILAPSGPSDDAIRHHARRCIPALLAGRADELRAEILTTVRGRVEDLLERAERLCADAEGDGALCKVCGEEAGAASLRDRAATITACKGVLELLARILGDICAEVDVKVILDSPRFAAEKAAIINALLPYPEAAAAVVAALRALTG